jgi:hypothetical protein
MRRPNRQLSDHRREEDDYEAIDYRVFALSMALPVAAVKSEIDPSWANGQLVYMIGPHVIQNAIQTQPNLYAHSEELYLLVYPINPSGTDTDKKALPYGYAPNCNPCYHPGLPECSLITTTY